MEGWAPPSESCGRHLLVESGSLPGMGGQGQARGAGREGRGTGPGSDREENSLFNSRQTEKGEQGGVLAPARV